MHTHPSQHATSARVTATRAATLPAPAAAIPFLAVLAAFVALAAFAALATPTARAWDYEGHRAINLLALESLPDDAPAFLRAPEARARIGYLAGEPDRWRNSADPSLRHINQIEHFMDIEDIEPARIAFSALPQFRYVFVAQLALAREARPQDFPKIDPARDKDATRAYPGFLPWAIAENYGKLKSGFSTLRALEEHGGTPSEIAQARAGILYIMGTMGHYVGDGCQPLHLTKHFNGWVGDNPDGNTTSRTIHAWIDGDFLNKTGGITNAMLAARATPAARLSTVASDPAGRDPVFTHILAYLEAQHPKVARLYALEKSGRFTPDNPHSKEGRDFIETQLLIGAKMLGDLWYTACKDATPDPYLIKHLETRKTKTKKTKD